MRIRGYKPSSLILSQRSYFKKLKRSVPKVPKQAAAKRDDVINSKITISINFNTEHFDGPKTLTNQLKSTVELVIFIFISLVIRTCQKACHFHKQRRQNV